MKQADDVLLVEALNHEAKLLRPRKKNFFTSVTNILEWYTANQFNSRSVCNEKVYILPTLLTSSLTAAIFPSQFMFLKNVSTGPAGRFYIFFMKRPLSWWEVSSTTCNTVWSNILASSTQAVPGLCLCVSYICFSPLESFGVRPRSRWWGLCRDLLQTPHYLHLPGEIAFLSLGNSLSTEGDEMGLASPCC